MVTEVPAIGDCIALSIATKTFWFASIAVNVWLVPIPTVDRPIGSAICFNAFSAVRATWTLSSPFFIIKTDDGMLNGAVLIPIDVPAPGEYFTFWPVVKKWLGRVIILLVRSTTSVLDPS